MDGGLEALPPGAEPLAFSMGQARKTRQFIRLRQDIAAPRGDDLRRETLQARMEVRRKRIEIRLYLSDA